MSRKSFFLSYRYELRGSTVRLLFPLLTFLEKQKTIREKQKTRKRMADDLESSRVCRAW